MSYLLELLGKGLDSDVGDILDRHFWCPQATNIERLKAECSEHPECPDLHLQLGLAQLRAVQLAEAIGYLKQACRHKPDYLAARLALAAALDSKGAPAAALEHLEVANQYHGGEPEILFAIGFCHERLLHPRKAAEYYRDVVALEGTFTPARERLAAVCVVTNDLDGAIRQYECLRDGEPSKTWIRLALGHLYYRAGRYHEAIEEYETTIAMEPENWSLVDDEVEVLVADGRIREAIERLNVLVEQQGQFPDLHVRLADLYSQVGDDKVAAKHYRRALELQPNYLEATVKLGTHHLICGRWDQASEAFHQASELNDKVLLSYVGLGVAQVAAGKTDQAMNSFDLAASVEPNTSLLLTEMARLQLKAAVADEFLKDFHEPQTEESLPDISLDNDDLLQTQIHRHAAEVSRRPNHADVRYRYGVLLRAEDRIAEAMEQFQNAVEINPTYVQALIKLGICRQELGMVEEAIETFEQVLNIHPQYVDMHYRLGLLYTDRKQFDQAVRHMEAASQGAGNNAQIRANLALSLQNMGLMDRAAAAWRSLREMHEAAKS